MIREFFTFKASGLLEKNFIPKISIKKCSLNIHLKYFKFNVRIIIKNKSNTFHSRNRGQKFHHNPNPPVEGTTVL